ncbi:MAG TPA: PPC domain-containing protein [Planctomycetota bacterium]|nr:PPC domain-containing protein [Planctomycetota bacterium]
MNPIRISLNALLALALSMLAVHAGQTAPRIGYVYPAGGQPGSSFQVTLGGQFLDGVANAYFTGGGIEATVVEHFKPLTVKQANDLKEKLQELQDKRNGTDGKKVALTAEEEAMIVEIRKQLSTFVAKTQVNPALAETVTLKVTIAANAEPGERDLRLRTPLGLTNPRVFCVGQLPEFTKNPAKVVRPAKNGRGAEFHPVEYETSIAVPATINGQIMPGGTDRFRFNAHKGQRLVFAINARQLNPYLPDAVPGWFQAALALYDGNGDEISYADHYEFHPDPVIYYEIPKDGEYVVEVKDTLYRGREDFVYRITVGEIPFVTSVFPLGGPAGTQTSVELKGWNLPMSRLSLDESGKTAGIYPFSVIEEQLRIGARDSKSAAPVEASLVSNRVPFAVDTLPECFEKEPNDSAATAQALTLPIIVNGRIDHPGDWDVFSFEGRAGTDFVAEVYARRLNSPLDSVLRLTDAAGKQLAFNDDFEDKGSGLNTHHADSYLRVSLPTNGTFYLYLGDAQHKGGEDYAYRLRVSAVRPDFALRVVPSSISARAGTMVPVTVYALRKDGFSKEIALSLKDAPKGFSLSGGVIPADQDQVKLTLAVPGGAGTGGDEPLHLKFEGRALIQGHDVVHAAVPADDMMQAFAYHHLVTAQSMNVVVMNRLGGGGGAGAGARIASGSGSGTAGTAKNSAKIVGDSPVRIPAGGTARVRVDTSASPYGPKAEFELSDPPDGITLQSALPTREGLELVLQCDVSKVKAGLKGNLIVSAFSSGLGAFAKDNPKAAKRKIPLGTLPAIPFEIVAR